MNRRRERGAPPELPRQRLCKVRARQVVLATGAHERPLVFADNDRPGVMLASAAQAYVYFSYDYTQAEPRAKSARRGIWASEFELPRVWRRQHQP